MAWGPALALQWWPSAAPSFISFYAMPLVRLIIAVTLLVLIGVTGAFIAGQAYLALVDSVRALLGVRSSAPPVAASYEPSPVSRPRAAGCAQASVC